MPRPPSRSSFDPGLPDIRTRLAWRRTGLSLAVGALVVGRIAAVAHGEGLFAPALLICACAVWAALLWLRRGAAARGDRRGTVTYSLLRDGRLPVLMAGLAGVLCVAQIVVALLR